ncbi:MAG: hypothetical protein EOO45_10790 [Flavobacterium sp.]|nr:MAG: hypothetical protein EOO45_10790 [Flavobacterium sp.]
MKIIRVIFLLLIIVSCEKENEYFFTFDEVVRYNVDRNLSDNLIVKKDQTEKDSITKNIIIGWHRTNTLSQFVKDLDKSHYTSSTVDTIHNSKLREIFKAGDTPNELQTTCEPMYRNVFVFRNKGKITGVAQICLDCGKSNFIGTKSKTENFGGNNEFDNLKQLLKIKTRY